jgi:ArsR family transcriptional regulator
MPALAARLRLFTDATRLRILHLLAAEPLTVAELQEILDLGQSSTSGHLAKLGHAGLIHAVAEGSARRYRWREDLTPALRQAWGAVRALSADEAIVASDRRALEQVTAARGAAWVDRVAGSLHREYAPGRTWDALGQGLAALLDLGRCVDIGAGDGALAALLAPRCRTLTCVDPSPAMVAAGTARTAGLGNVAWRAATGEHLPLPDASHDTALFLQSLQYIADPASALAETRRILAPGGRLLVLTLAAHTHAEAERYGHRHCGFAQAKLKTWCRGLDAITITALPPETRPPHFQSLLLTARAP